MQNAQLSMRRGLPVAEPFLHDNIQERLLTLTSSYL